MSQATTTNSKKANAGQNSAEYFTLETTDPLAGRGETLTLKEWKRVYGYPDNLLGRGKLVAAPQPPQPIALNAPAPADRHRRCPKPPKQVRLRSIIGFQRGTFYFDSTDKTALLECSHAQRVSIHTTTADKVACAECAKF